MTTPLEHWRATIEAWRIPGSAYVPRRAVTVATPAETTSPEGSRSYARELEALPPGGSVLDVGSGAGGASLPLAARAGLITGVDPEEHLLEALRTSGANLGVPIETITGRWPDAAPGAQADVVVCHHVLYGAADLAPFVAALTAHARHRVVIELPEHHPQHALNPLWEHFHGIRRPDGPTAREAAEAIAATGAEVEVEPWPDHSGWGEYTSFTDMTDRVRRRLSLPAERAPEVAAALRELGVDPERPRYPGTAGRTLFTLWWQP